MALPFEDRQFDVATMALVLFFVPDPARGIAEMKRVVRSDGVLAAYVWDMLGGGAPHEPIHAALRLKNIKYPLPPSVEASRMENLRHLWSEAGLRSIDTKIIAVERTFDNFEDFWNTTTSSAAFISVLNDLDVATLDELKNSTREILAVNVDDPVICNGFANCIKGVV